MSAAAPNRVTTLVQPPATDGAATTEQPRRPRRRRRSNLLALAVLSCLAERPMHPYEMATTMRTRGKHDSIKLNYGSLYGVVEGLERDGLVARVRTVRDGRRPERTIYRITEAGRVELTDWEGDLLSVPVKEFTRFEAGLSLIVTLDPEEAVQRLHERCGALEAQLAGERALLATCEQRRLLRLFVIELEYRAAMREAELTFTRALAREIETGALDGMRWWRAVYDELASAAAEQREPVFPEPYEPPELHEGGETEERRT
ncbi:MAG TPA: PadR family transcriptional regulator [Solirubrobacteraceae bacterium]|nr:PadR family transcriptional regulator [Solirubrobacteraceae bacterium]